MTHNDTEYANIDTFQLLDDKISKELHVQSQDCAVERCTRMIADLEDELGLHITIHDLKGALSLPNGQPLLLHRNYHLHPYCQLGRQQNRYFDKHCKAHCHHRVAKQAHHSEQSFTGRCWKGVHEIITPIWEQGHNSITIFAGAFRDELDCPDFAGRTRKILQAYNKLPLKPEYTEIIGRKLRQLGHSLLHECRELHAEVLSETHFPTEPARYEAIRQFIQNHAHQECSLKQLADHLFLSESRCSHVVREQCGTSFQDLLIQERLKRAKYLLRSSAYTQEYIARECGFQSAPYFSRLFLKKVGESPGAYRKANRTKQDQDAGI